MDYKETIQQMISDGVLTREDAEKYCPELIESEDERIRKEIIQSIQDNMCVIHKDKCIAWLEKQGEQKPADKVEPKFKVGDWIVNNEHNNNVKVLEINNEQYRLDYCDTIGTICVDLIDNDYHLWTIQDAKDGDVLVTPLPEGYKAGEQIFIFKEIKCRDYVANCIEYHCRVWQGVFYENEIGYMGTTGDIFYPATEEQRDQLYKAMYEAGYVWDEEKLELKKIEPKPAEWSEEDEHMFNTIANSLNREQVERVWNTTEEEVDNWLKSIKDRVGNFDDGYKVGFSAAKHNQWKPSARQMSAFQYALGEGGVYDKASLEALYNDLKKL